MKNDQQDLDSKRLWGLKKKSLSNKPKEQRILETIDRLVPESKMTKGNAYEETSQSNLSQVTRCPQR